MSTRQPVATPDPPPLAVTIPTAARLVDCHPQTIRRWITRGMLTPVRLPAVTAGRESTRVRVRLADLQALVEASTER